MKQAELTALPTEAETVEGSILDEIEQIVETSRDWGDLKSIRRALKTAQSIKRLRELMTRQVVEQLLMPLMNSPLGFKCDKPDYPWEVVRDCAIAAAMNGADWTNNEFNIIAGNHYLTKNFFLRVCYGLPGVADLRMRPGVPEAKQGGCIVPFRVLWLLHGEEREIDAQIPVKVNAGMGADAILGKATRKALSRMYQEVTGQIVGDGDATEDDSLSERKLSDAAERVRTQTAAKRKAPEAGKPEPEPERHWVCTANGCTATWSHKSNECPRCGGIGKPAIPAGV